MKRAYAIVAGKRGSALIWALIFIIVLSIVVVGGLSIGVALNNRTLSREAQQQAYYTAQSVAQSVTGSLSQAKIGEGKANEAGEFVEKLQSARTHETKIAFPESAHMGTCAVTFRYEENTGDIVIICAATYAEQAYTMRATLKRETRVLTQDEKVNSRTLFEKGEVITAWGGVIYAEGEE